MRISKYIFLSIILLWRVTTHTYAYSIHKIGSENGLSNNNVVSIAQDRDGFIWICTKDGLNRFDANTFKVFKKSDIDNDGLSSNVLNYVYADKFDDIIWVATEKNGVDAYNYRTNTYKHYRHDHTGANPNTIIADGVTQISSDSKGNIWFATYWGGLDYFDKETETFHHYNQSNIKGLGSNYNWTIFVENDETIYAGHVNDGFSIINKKTKTAINFKHDPKNPSSLCDNTVTYIFKDSQNNIWIGTRNGLTLFDPLTYQIKNFKNDPENPFSLSSNYVKSILQTNDYKLWIGTDGGGVNILDLSTFSKDKNPKGVCFEHIGASLTSEGLSSLSVQTLFQDNFGNIWLGGYGGGINFVPNIESIFKKISYLPYVGNTNSLADKNVYGMCVDSEDKVWVANSLGGIEIYDKERKIKSIEKISNQGDQWSAS
ncbi:MAG: hybrid sensor histidine kinase/response regulator, partial [Salinivirgaceae bacterium]|nr:hybrid sensor histidine kinase/response regulator [Salinivirgaceae bacterium]